MTKNRPLKIVILDDDPSIVRLVSTVLTRSLKDSIQLVNFDDPYQAQSWMDVNCCDILISDIEMPSISGLEMLRYAKSRNAWTQVVFLTGASSWNLINEAIEAGASDYLVKPLKPDVLISLISQQCERLNRWHEALYESPLRRQNSKTPEATVG